MKSVLPICFLMLTNICCGQVVDHKLFCGEYTYIQIRAESPRDYPILFDAIVNQDTIYVDISDINTFTKSLFLQAAYIPIAESAYQRGIEILFGSGEKIFGYGLCLANMLGSQLEESQRKGVISLLNGDYILYKYAKIRAGFVELNKSCDWKYTKSSIGIEDSSIVNRVVIPISVIDVNKVETEISIIESK